MSAKEAETETLERTEATAEAQSETQALEQAIEEGAAHAPQVSPEIERKAREMGWVPQTEWRGAPEAWRPADEFVRRGEEVLPIVRSNLERERAERKRLETEMRDLPKRIREELNRDYADRFRRLEGISRIALEKQREQLYNQFEAEKRKAVADGNTEEYDRLSREQRQALAEFHVETGDDPGDRQPEGEHAAAQAARLPPQVEPVVRSWIRDNADWFLVDPEMRDFAKEVHGGLLAYDPDMPIEENLAKTLEATKRKFPDRFGLKSNGQTQGQRTAHAPQVEGGARQPQTSGSRPRGWNDLPPEAKASGDKFIRQDGLFLPPGVDPDTASEADIKKARDAYAKDYWSLA